MVASVLPALAIALIGGACSPAARAFGADGPTARTHADGIFFGFARRFGPLSRDEQLLAVRPRLLKSFLTPSALFRDDEMWSSSRDSSRTLAVGGGLIDGRYVLAKRNVVGRPAYPGATRHLMHLRHVGGDVYEWDSSDQLAVGQVRARELHAVATRTLAALEGRDARAIRAGLAIMLPRASTAAGRLLSIETLETRAVGDGSTSVTIGIRLEPDRMKEDSPHMATYLERYLSSAKYDIAIDDSAGTPWLRIHAERGVLTLKWRTHDGKLQPMEGPLREAPDVFRLRFEAMVRVFVFSVGASELEGELRVIDEPNARGWEIALREEPEWHLPLVSEQLLRSPLRRPFEGDGAMVRYVARDSAGAQTLLIRDLRAQVQESTVLRFLNKLGNKMASDMDERTEAELLSFISETILALHRDVIAFLPEEPRISASEPGSISR